MGYFLHFLMLAASRLNLSLEAFEVENWLVIDSDILAGVVN